MDDSIDRRPRIDESCIGLISKVSFFQKISCIGDYLMFRRRKEIRERLLAVVKIFREKGAVSPERAMTAQELGLPPRFQDAMKRRLGRGGVFVEVNGKYYLSEEKLRQVEERYAAGKEC